MINDKYPYDWSLPTLKELTAEFLNGGTPSTHIREYWGGDIPWITGADAEQKTTVTARKSITNLGVKRSSTHIVPKNNILMVTRTGVGKVSISGVDVAISQDLTGIIPKTDLVDVEYLYYQLARICPTLDTLAQGSIIQGIQREEVETLVIPLPALPEQRQIAEILSTLDAAIEQTQALIRKLERVKQGLMADLLTRGVDENGEVRPRPEDAPHIYHKTMLGPLPKEWSIIELSKVATVERGKFTPRPRNDPKYYDGGYPFIQTGEVASANGRRISRFSQTLNELGTTVSRDFPAETIVVTIAANIGETAILAIPMYLPDSLVGVIVNQPNNVRFLEMGIRSNKERFNAIAPQSAQKNINLGDLRPMLIPFPEVEEQGMIARMYDSIENSIILEEHELTKLCKIRLGLMQDLLSGAVRVV
ncbi:MAG: restriction endonuclease subunit S [Chloroflexota bacterium]